MIFLNGPWWDTEFAGKIGTSMTRTKGAQKRELRLPPNIEGDEDNLE